MISMNFCLIDYSFHWNVLTLTISNRGISIESRIDQIRLVSMHVLTIVAIPVSSTLYVTMWPGFGLAMNKLLKELNH